MNTGTIPLRRIAATARVLARRLPLGATVDAEDLEHEAVVAALLGRKSTLGPMQDCLRKQGWMQECRASYKHRLVRVDFSVCARMPAPGDGPDVVSVKNQMALHLKEALLALTPRSRKVIHLRYWENMKLARIAALLGVNESRAWQIEQAAILKLKLDLQKTEEAA